MKKLILFLFAMVIVSVAFAQSTSPRFGTLKNQDNTGRVLTYKMVNVTDAVGADTVKIQTNAYETIYKVAAVDSITFKVNSVKTSCFGDKLTILAQGTSGSPKIKFTNSSGLWLTAGTATMSTNRRAIIVFMFDGAKWVEVSRYVQ